MLNVLRHMMILWSRCALFSIRRQCAKIKPTVELSSLRFCSIFNVSGIHKEQIQEVFSLNKMKKLINEILFLRSYKASRFLINI